MAPVTKESAAFAFRGTVKQRGAANLKAITDTARTAVVTVDEIVRSPPALAGFVGHDITVQLAANEQVRNGERGVFYVTGFVFGETLAVQSVGHDSVPAAQPMVAASIRAADGDPTRAFRQTKARERAERAPVVVTGKVVAVGLADSEPTPVTAAAVAARERARAVLAGGRCRGSGRPQGGSTLAPGGAAFPRQQRCPLAPFAEISGRPGRRVLPPYRSGQQPPPVRRGRGEHGCNCHGLHGTEQRRLPAG
jgi:hypothetical protein